MIKAKNILIGHISDKGNLSGKLSNAVIQHYPELENLEIKVLIRSLLSYS